MTCVSSAGVGADADTSGVLFSEVLLSWLDEEPEHACIERIMANAGIMRCISFILNK